MTAHAPTVVIPAHNEAAVIHRPLDGLSPAAAAGLIRVIVVCNGCTDATARIAATYPGVEVEDIATPSKVAALRHADTLIDGGVRLYVDADIVISPTAVADVASALDGSGALAGRPSMRFDTGRASWVVRRWYAVRERLPSISSALWGAGVYAMSEQGRARFDVFPDIVSDDLFVDRLFSGEEVVIVDTEPVIVTTPRRVADLLRILQRSYRTQSDVLEDEAGVSSGQRGQLRDLLGLVRSDPRRLVDVGVYVAVVVTARIRARRRPTVAWERDTSSRS